MNTNKKWYNNNTHSLTHTHTHTYTHTHTHKQTHTFPKKKEEKSRGKISEASFSDGVFKKVFRNQNNTK